MLKFYRDLRLEIKRRKAALEALVIGQFGAGFVTDEMLKSDGIKEVVGGHSTQISQLGADKEDASNKIAVIDAASTDAQYPSGKAVYNAVYGLAYGKHYTARWDKVNAQMSRLNDATDITTTTTNFGHFGSLNPSYDNPFDSIYPWSGITLCNIDIDLYLTYLANGGDATDCVTAFLGDPSFSYTDDNGVWRYTPEFWGRDTDDGTYRYFDICDKEYPGHNHYRAKIGGRWWGQTATRTIGGSSKVVLLPKVGMPAKDITMSTLHTYAKNMSATLDNIYTIDGDTLLFLVEFATMNSQTALGRGVDDLYSQSGHKIQENASTSATVKVLTSRAANCIANAIFDIGSSDGGRQVGSYIISATEVDTDPTKTIIVLTTDGSTPASVTATTSNFWSIHGLANVADTDIGKASGYIGANGKSNAYYRGTAFHANLFRYVLGVYRQTGTGAIWIAADEVAADALNTAAHIDTGLVLSTTSNYIQTLGAKTGLSCAPFCTAVGGSSANPVGDFCYVPTLATGNTILLLGGNANDGVGSGRFYSNWNNSAANSHWSIGAFPLLKTP